MINKLDLKEIQIRRKRISEVHKKIREIRNRNSNFVRSKRVSCRCLLLATCLRAGIWSLKTMKLITNFCLASLTKIKMESLARKILKWTYLHLVLKVWPSTMLLKIRIHKRKCNMRRSQITLLTLILRFKRAKSSEFSIKWKEHRCKGKMKMNKEMRYLWWKLWIQQIKKK